MILYYMHQQYENWYVHYTWCARKNLIRIHVWVKCNVIKSLWNSSNFFYALNRVFKTISAWLSYLFFIVKKNSTWGNKYIFKTKNSTFNKWSHYIMVKYFTFLGNFSTHYGIFEGCGKSIPFSSGGSNKGGAKGSCC